MSAESKWSDVPGLSTANPVHLDSTIRLACEGQRLANLGQPSSAGDALASLSRMEEVKDFGAAARTAVSENQD